MKPIYAFEFDGKGGASPLEIKNVDTPLPAKQFRWLHFDRTKKEVRQWIKKESGLDPIVVTALLAEETRPRLTEFPNGLLIVLRGMNFNPGKAQEDMISLRMWIDDTRVITLRNQRLMAISDICDAIKANQGPKTPGDFLASISNLLLGRMSSAITEIEEDLDAIEESLLEGNLKDLRKDLIEIRTRSITFRRYISPQRDIVAKLQTYPGKLLSEKNKVLLRESNDHATRYVENLDLTRERASIVQDELTNALSERLNRNTYLLSVVAAVFLPLGFFTGLFGINVGGIPGADFQPAFMIFSASMAGIGAVLLGAFKLSKWL